MNEQANNPENIPSIKNRDSLNALSLSYKPNDAKFLLSLNAQYSMEECRANAIGMVKRLEKFANNDYKYDNLQGQIEADKYIHRII